MVLANFHSKAWSQYRDDKSHAISPSACLIVAQHPVDQVISRYYASCYQNDDCPYSHVEFNDLTTEDLLSWLRGDVSENNNRSGGPPVRSMTLHDESLNLEGCIVGLEEEWTATKKMIDHWFPWIDISSDDIVEKHQTTNDTLDVRSVRQDLRNLIEGFYSHEMKVLSMVYELFEKQRSVVDSNAYL